MYVEYKIKTAFGNDDDDTLVRVCGKDDTDYKIHKAIPWFFDRFDKVQFKLCREEGPRGFPDSDSCTDLWVVV